MSSNRSGAQPGATAAPIPSTEFGAIGSAPYWWQPANGVVIPGCGGVTIDAWCDEFTLGLWHWFPGPEMTGGELEAGWVFVPAGSQWVDIMRYDPIDTDVAASPAELHDIAAEYLHHNKFEFVQASTKLGVANRGWFTLPVLLLRAVDAPAVRPWHQGI